MLEYCPRSVIAAPGGELGGGVTALVLRAGRIARDVRMAMGEDQLTGPDVAATISQT